MRPGRDNSIASLPDTPLLLRRPSARLATGIRRFGVRGLLAEIARRARQRYWIEETHIWFEVAPASVARRARLRGGQQLVAGASEHIGLLGRLPTEVTDAEAERRLADDEGALWLVLDGDEPLFCCWVFERSAPVAGAPDGRLDMPDGFAVVEDVATSERHRGRGVAPAALATLVRRLEPRPGLLLAKVDHRNRASRRAFRKAGFRPVAQMRRRERGPFTSVAIEGSPARRSVAMLRARLAR